jgi:hypothetical protein
MPGLALTKGVMFGFSITKLLFTLAVVIVAWNGFKWFTRVQENRAVGKFSRGERPAMKQGSAKSDGAVNAEEMVKCSVCETYVSFQSAVSCGINGCPYPR